MKKTMIIFAIVLLSASVVNAAPFLVCDPVAPDALTHYVVERDVTDQAGNTTVVSETVAPDPVSGQVRLKYDLVGYGNGVYTFRIYAVKLANADGTGSYGVSEKIPFVFTREATSPPAALGLSLN